MKTNLKEKFEKVEKGILVASNCFFAGIVLGFLLAPIKQGISCGNNNGNQTNINLMDKEE